jgi:TIR domain
MATVPPSAPGRIFISYRREETAYPAGWLYDRLADHYGGGQVFKDVDSIQLGDDFVEVITRAVGSCDVLLALIGDQWLTITDEHGRRRLDDPDDFVRLEIEAALSRNVRVIPILVDGARMPRTGELPGSLAALVRRQALELSPARFDFDTGRLLRVLDGSLAEVRAGQAEPSPAQSAPQAAAAAPPAAPPASRPGGPPGERPRRRSTRARVLAGAAAAVVLIAVVAVVVANSGTTQSPTGAASVGPPAGAATTSTSAGSATTSAPAAPAVFRDDFADRTGGWEGDGAQAKGSGYVGGAYRISAPAKAEGGGAGSVPTKAGDVYPYAPPRIRIQVEGRRLPASDQGMSYGILCRIKGEDAYALTISDGYASIEKYGRYKLLKETQPQVNPSSRNKLRAVCAGGEGRQPVHLELWVNGRKIIEATDRNAPLATGAVGLIVGTYQTTRASLAEFDDFVVEQVA